MTRRDELADLIERLIDAAVCECCGRRARRLGELESWNARVAAGALIGARCPDCQTDE